MVIAVSFGFKAEYVATPLYPFLSAGLK